MSFGWCYFFFLFFLHAVIANVQKAMCTDKKNEYYCAHNAEPCSLYCGQSQFHYIKCALRAVAVQMLRAMVLFIVYFH